MNRIQKTEEFLKNKLYESEYMQEHQVSLAYRLEHSYRVANIGKQIAQAEGLNVELMVIACLLHDVSYCMEFNSKQDWLDHGRNAALIARPFLLELGLSSENIDEICYGIAIHVDDVADCLGTKNAFTLSIGDADNIDRFDVYRLYENFESMKFSEMSIDDKLNTVDKGIARLKELKKMELGTRFATKIWNEKIEYQIDFYEKLKSQLKQSRSIW